MPKELSVQPVDYAELVALLQKEMSASLKRVQSFVDRQKITTNWRIGKFLAQFIQKNNKQAEYKRTVFLKLAQDLNVRERYLHQTLQFYRTYPKLPSSNNINWTHYSYLISVSDKKLRHQLEAKTDSQKLTVIDLRELIQSKTQKQTKDVESLPLKLSVTRGLLYTYRLIQSDNLHKKSPKFVIDCGFDIYIDKPETQREVYNKQTFVRSFKEDKSYRLKKAICKKNDLYTYVGLIKRVVDGDMLVAIVDCGFAIETEQRLRLRGIDAPELNSPLGNQAKEYVKKALSQCECVVLKTYGSDKYDRYLVDVFYMPKERDPYRIASEGRFLNQELLDKGLAEVYQ